MDDWENFEEDEDFKEYQRHRTLDKNFSKTYRNFLNNNAKTEETEEAEHNDEEPKENMLIENNEGEGNSSTPVWVWIIVPIVVVLFIVAMVLHLVYGHRTKHYKKTKLKRAADLPPHHYQHSHISF